MLPVRCSRFSLVIYFVCGISSVYMSIQSPNSSYPFFPPGIHIFDLYMCLYFSFANKIIYNIFLDSTYMHIDNIYFSLSELLHSDTLQYTDQEYDSGRLGSTHSFGPIPRSFPVHCFLLDSHQHRQCLQWLRLCTVSIPGWGTKNLMLHGQKKKKNP